MNPLRLLCLGFLLVAAAEISADESHRFVCKATFPGSTMNVVVAEGDFEPKSIGSYSLRIYGGTNPRFPRDDFIAGTVRPREGAVEDVRFSQPGADGPPGIVIIMRSAGTGGMLSADAFQLRGSVLRLLGSVSGLAADADPVRALEADLGNGAEARLALQGARRADQCACCSTGHGFTR
jgi:hypothetical protein